MDKKIILGKFLFAFAASVLTVGLAAQFSDESGRNGSGAKQEKNTGDLIELDVYSQLSSFSGEQEGWSADILKDKLGIKINILPEMGGAFESGMRSGDLGDIIIWSSTADQYSKAVKAGLLLDWEKDGLLEKAGADIQRYMPKALAKNKVLTGAITEGKSDVLYGFGGDVALSVEDHEPFFHTWDCRWDLYRELGYPEIKDLDDLGKLFLDMQKLCPEDDAGNKTYAVSLWPDWDESMLLYAAETAKAYYGYDILAMGLYDSQTGDYHDALEEDGPYLEMLQFYNRLYQQGLLDPESESQSYDQVREKVQNGAVLFSVFNYLGSGVYNTEEHLQAGKMMQSMKPEEAAPIAYGISVQGGDRVWSIGAECKHPEKAMELVNYLCTPEGWMTMQYGPQGVTWDYDGDGHPFFTELGRKCQEDALTSLESAGYHGTYIDGVLQIVQSTWAYYSENPDSNGDTFAADLWPSNIAEPQTEIEQDWCDRTGADSVESYLEAGKHVVQPKTFFELSFPVDRLKKDTWDRTWEEVAWCIQEESWKALYAKTDQEFQRVVAGMRKKADRLGYDTCKEWSQKEAAIKKSMEDAINNK